MGDNDNYNKPPKKRPTQQISRPSSRSTSNFEPKKETTSSRSTSSTRQTSTSHGSIEKQKTVYAERTGSPKQEKPNGKPKKTKKPQKPQARGVVITKSIFGGIGKTILAIFLIFVIVGCIAATAMTVFVMKYVDSDPKYDLHNVQETLTSRIYAVNSNGDDEVIRTMTGSGRRDWVDLDQIPQHVQDAVVCAEDERFFEHEGVDWVRTFAAFANLATGGALNFNGGASTITQQVIKNINGDFGADTRTPSTKLKEILSALNVEKNYTKQEILAAYINLFSMGRNNYGIQAAAQYYYGKDVSELSIVEAASLACITKSPENNNPIASQEKNKQRRDWVLSVMLERGKITQAEYDEAVAVTELPTVGSSSGGSSSDDVFSWYEDAVIRRVKLDLMEKYGYDEDTALGKIKGGGLQIYSAENIDLQNQLQEEFNDPSNFYSRDLDGHPDAAMVIMDYDGYIRAMVGSREEKTGATTGSTVDYGTVMMGSCMKPITAYAPALEENRITWGTVLQDEPVTLEKSSDNPVQGNGKNWPKNWNSAYSGSIEVHQALYLSKNTIPVYLVMQKGVTETLQWLENQLGLSTIVYGSDGAATTLGSMTKGVHLDEFTAAYTMFGNNGVHQERKYYSKVLDATGKVILEADTEGTQVIGSDTAYIMNRMMREVISQKGATGTAASLDSMGIEVVGKTGTTEDTAVSFVGLTPYYISSIWMGDPLNSSTNLKKGTYYSPQNVWKNIMSDIYQGYEAKDFSYLDSTGVVEKNGGYYKQGITDVN